MAEIARVLRDEAIVQTTTEAAILAAVPGTAVVNGQYQTPPGLSLIRLTPAPTDQEPSLVRRIRSTGIAADHNYVMAQMTHSQFQPISYYRPHPTVALSASAEKLVEIVVIDTPVLEESPVAPFVDPASSFAKLSSATDQDPLVFHGGFVAGVVLQVEPRAKVEVIGAQDVRPDNFFTDWELACQIMKIAARSTPPDIVSLSLGSSPLIAEAPVATAAALDELADTVTVFAAAGNDGAELKTYPAAYEGVLGVGGQPPAGERKADFSNSGDYVDLWAPAVDRIGPFVDRTVGFKDTTPGTHLHRHHVDDLPPSSLRAQNFDGWARGDGTSFATPYMAGWMAKELVKHLQAGLARPQAIAEAKDDVIGQFNSANNTRG